MSGAGDWGGGGRRSLLHRRFYDSSQLSSCSADTYSSPAASQVPEALGMPGTKGLSGLADPDVGSRKQVPLCVLPRHPSQPLHTHPSKQTDRRGSLVLFSLLPGFWLIHTIMRLFLKSLVNVTGKHWELCPWSSLHAPKERVSLA